MKTQRIILTGALAMAVTIGAGLWAGEAPASPVSQQVQPSDKQKPAAEDPFHAALGVASDEEVYEALYDGQTLARIASEHDGDVDRLIDLQVAQLTEQLETRFKAGWIQEEQYRLQKEELRGLVEKSVYGA